MAEEIHSQEEIKELREELLKEFGIKTSPNATYETLMAKLTEATSGKQLSESDLDRLIAEPDYVEEKKDSELEKFKSMNPFKRKKYLMQLIRVRIINMDAEDTRRFGMYSVNTPDTEDVTRIIPLLPETGADAWHIPRVLLNHLKEMKFPKTVKDPKTQRPVTTWVPRFNFEILPELTQEELEALRKHQMLLEGAGENKE